MYVLGQSAISNVYHAHYHFHSHNSAACARQVMLAENQPMAGLSSLNEYDNGMGKSEIELLNLSPIHT